MPNPELANAPSAYRPLLELGRGELSRVYVAESLSSGVPRLFVLKELHAELSADPAVRAAFLREAEIGAQLNHPNIVQVFGVIEHEATIAIAMQYVDGLPLSEVLRRREAELPLALHVHVLAQLLSGLHYFHELESADCAPLNFVHRSVSPQNVLLQYDGGVKVVDFGAASVSLPLEGQTKSGMLRGKLRYVSAEQWLGQTGIDRRADIYAVGVMLWEAVAKQRLWTTRDASQIARCVVRGELPSIRSVVPSVSEELAVIIERALARDRELRYPTALAMQRELDELLAGQPFGASARHQVSFMREHFEENRQVRRMALRVAMRASKSAEPSSDDFEAGESAVSTIAFTERRPRARRSLGWRHSGWAALATLVVLALVGLRGVFARTDALAHAGTSAATEASPAGLSAQLPALHPTVSALEVVDSDAVDSHAVDDPAADATPARDGPVPASGVHEAEDLGEGRHGETGPGESAAMDEDKAARGGARTQANSARHRTRADERTALGDVAEIDELAGPAQRKRERCNPPYRLEQDGVKVFDPACF